MAGKETTIIEDVQSIFDKSGSVGRTVLMDLMEGEATTLDDMREILRGEKFVPVRDFKSLLEDKTGLDFTFGTGNPKEDNIAQTGANFVTDLALDIFTSPDSLLGAPAKLARLGKMGKFATNPEVVRGIQGATLGLLARGEDDDWTEVAGKVATGAGLGAFGVPVAKSIGSGIGKAGTHMLDKMAEKNFSGAFDAYHNYVKARATKNIGKRTRQIAEDLEMEYRTTSIPGQERAPEYLKEVRETLLAEKKALKGDAQKKAISKINNLSEDALVEQGKLLRAKRFGEEASRRAHVEAMNVKPLTLSQAEKLQTEAMRDTEKYSRYYKSEADEVISKFEQRMAQKGLSPEKQAATVLDFRNRVAKGFASIVDVRKQIEKDVFDQLKQAGQTADKYEVARYATSEANKKITAEVLQKAEENPLIRETIVDWVDFNRKTAKTFNDAMYKRARGLSNTEAKEFLDKVFIPIDLHTIDTKAMDDLAEGAKMFSDNFGPTKRLSSIVDVNPNVSMREAVEIGANRYASWFADQAQSEAKSLLSVMYDAKNPSSVLSKVMEQSKRLGKRMVDPNVPVNEKFDNDIYNSYIDGFDKMTNMLKTKHLATGTSWAMLNYPDNVLKALVAAGPTTAMKIAARVPMQALSNLGDFLTAGRLKNLKDRNTFGKMLSAYDPTDTITKIDYADDFMEAGMQYHALDSNQFIDIFQLAKVNGGVLDMKMPSTKAKAIKDAVESAPTIEKVADNLQSFLWKTVGSFGSAIEGTSRHILFKDLALGEAKRFPELNQFIKDGKLMDLLKLRIKGGQLPTAVGGRAGTKATDIALAQMDEAFSTAAKITNDTFFDYKNINAFERHFVKRIMPYWTFKSRDMMFWLQNMFEPEKIQRIAQGTRLHTAGTDPLSERQRMRTPQYMLEKGARVVSDDGVNLELKYSPSLSLTSTANQLPVPGADPFRELLGGINPLLKTPVELATNTETLGSGLNVYPDEEKPTKQIFEQAFTMLPDDILKSLGVYRDNEGRVKTNNDRLAQLLKVQEALPLVPSALDQTARTIRDVKYRDYSVGEAVLNNFVPIKKRVKIGPKQGRRELLRAIRNKRKLESNNRQDVLGRR